MISRNRGISRRPSPYPSFLFHAIRTSQTISSLIVTMILAYFIHHLRLSYYRVPWTFILLLTVSSLTVAYVLVSTYFFHQRSLKPQLSQCLSAGLTFLWTIGLAVMFWNLSGTLGNRCSIEDWGTEEGVMVCRVYKALAAFTTFGLVTTIGSLILDLRTQRLVISRGTYNVMADRKALHLRSASRIPLAPNDNAEPRTAAHPMLLDASPESPDFVCDGAEGKAIDLERPIERGDFEYAALDSPSYRGAGGDLGDGFMHRGF